MYKCAFHMFFKTINSVKTNISFNIFVINMYKNSFFIGFNSEQIN